LFVPIGDSPRPSRFTPYVTWSLVAANVAVYLLVTLPLSAVGVDPRDPALQEYLPLVAPGAWLDVRALSQYDLLVFAWGYKPAVGGWASLFSSLFLHGGFWHLAGNMLFLAIYGRNVEHRLGRLGFLVAYLASGVCATLAFAALVGSSMTPLVGASGAISGVLGLYFVLFPRNKVKMLVAFPPIFFDVFLVPARLVLGFYVVADNLLPLLLGSDTGVAYGAHLGGFLAGVLVAGAGERLGWQWPWKDPRWRLGWRSAGSRRPETMSRELGPLRTALSDGDRTAALTAIPGLTTERLAELRPDECVVLSRWLWDAGHDVAATNLLRLCLAAHTGSRELALVHLALGLMRLQQNQPTAAYQHLLTVFDYEPDPETAERARQALAQIDQFRRGGRFWT